MRLLTGKSRVKAARLIAGGALAAGALLPTLQPARAGEWQIMEVQSEASPPNVVAKDEVVTGNRTTNIDGVSSSTPFKQLPSSGGPLYWSFNTGSFSYDATKVSAAVDFNGRARVILRWKREGSTPEEQAADNPPAVVMLRVRAKAEAEAVSDINASHRMEGTEHVSASVNVDDSNADGVTAQQDVFSSNGKAVKAETPLMLIPVEVPPGGGDRVEGPWCQLRANATIDGDRVVPGSSSSSSSSSGEGGFGDTNLTGKIQAGVSYHAQEDNRRVWIDSTIGQTYRKGPSLGACDSEGSLFERSPNLRKPDGSITVDVVADWLEGDDSTVPVGCTMSEWVKFPSFTASHQNFTTPDYAWSAEGGGFFYDTDSDIAYS